MLSPTLALRCPHCQHALSLADLRDAAACPACGVLHGLPPAVADALALYERAIQQAVSDLVRSAPVPTASAAVAEIAPPGPPDRPRHQPGPAARLLAAPVPPTTLLSIGPAPAPAVPAPVRPVLKDSLPADAPQPGDTLQGPAAAAPGHRPGRSTSPRPGSLSAELAAGLAAHGHDDEPAPLFAQLSLPVDSPVHADSRFQPVLAASHAPPVPQDTSSVPTDSLLAHQTAPAGLRRSHPPVPADSPAAPDAPLTGPGFDPAALSGPLPAPPEPAPGLGASLARHPAARMAAGDTVPGGAVSPANSSLLAILYNRSGASLSTPSSTAGLAAPPGGLAEAPLVVAAVRDPEGSPPSPSTHELVAAVRSFLPDRPDPAGPEPEGRIPASALAVARRALLARHADERRQQQVRDGSLGLLFAAVVCVGLLLFGLWYVAAPIAVLAVLLRLRREERGERFGAEVQRLGDALGGQRLPSYDAIAAWFDRLWPAPVSPEAMWTSHLHGAVRCDVHGYPALVDVHLNEKTAGGVVYPPRITAYLAAIWPGRVPSLRPTAADLSPAAQARLARLRKAGYTVVADANGGLVMRASESIAQAVRADITRLPALQVPIGELADLARDLGAEPVPAP
ncbi:hypothetical protein SAMN02745121_07663 [Nannocystis exedens]|uniref:Uncharacterized protein n=1 Tax=Nannocystis exedens TaxID=54 RepID=A0A1I2H414_9BACT|nr:hypothetical protein [Nannocystis exedens]PCC67098.1 hypothetical protein NAEX_00101 [Nannocystis exedens]SFF23717.1 hypothetical protein SAMN02745121_07663 [Nannocystis exedens]